MTGALKFFYLAGTTIITCVLLSVGFNIFYKMESVSKSVLNDMSEERARMEEGKLTVFDNSLCQGYEVINLLNREFSGAPDGKECDMYIKIISGDKEVIHNGSRYLSDIRNPESECYIRPLSEYKGSIVRDKNNSIIGMEFREVF